MREDGGMDIPAVEFCRTCGHVVHTVARFCICGCTDGYPSRAGQAPDTSPAPDAATSAEPSAPPAATGESDVLRTASAGEAHEIDAEWDTEAQAWHHRCVRCGADSIGDMPLLPCDPDTGGPA